MDARQGLAARLLRVLPGRERGTAVAPAANDAGYADAIEASLNLDREIGRKLDEAVGRTEASALAIMQQVRALCDGSAALATRLHGATRDACAFQQDIDANVEALARMAHFLDCLPQRLKHDLECISGIAEEIRGLSGLAESVQTISMQSHLLSINAAIEAIRAGAAGGAFKVVAEEARALAANSHAAAARIGGSLQRIRGMLKEGLEQNAAKSAEDLAGICQTAQAIAQLQGSFDRVRGSYHAGLTEMLEHGEALAASSADVLGQLQFQDVVRQCVERLQDAIAQRNAAFEAEFLGNAAPQPALLAGLIGDILTTYLANEQLHGGSPDAADSGPAIELF